jgi:hypothetical protein
MLNNWFWGFIALQVFTLGWVLGRWGQPKAVKENGWYDLINIAMGLTIVLGIAGVI